MSSIAERHKYILDTLQKEGFVKVTDAANYLNVTTATIRNDLKFLEEKKLLFRTHGSASVINPHTIDLKLTEKEKIKINEKRKIARAAYNLIEKNDSIIVGAGSTVFALAEQIRPMDQLTVVTASLKVSILLNEFVNTQIIQLGGSLRKNSVSVIGDYTSRFFDDVTCSKVFLGVDGIDSEFGITNSNIEEAQLNKRMIDASLKSIILADSSKFGKRGFGRICSLDRVDVIVTDSGITDSMAGFIENAGIRLVVTD
ncbi:MAG: DeoR/GlpR family DNA-binding transcription regulator [Bacteroidales bacterium]|jgi:DeoR family transcriptional regulator of aga operon|nr:DeoR/GlpR family DNA-binding transcription regulator [Bacteroidales bacterium]